MRPQPILPARKLPSLFPILALLAPVSPAGAQLRIDFNSTTQDGGPHNQAGYEAYDAGHEVAADFVTMDYDVFGTTISITPDWPNTTEATVRQMIDRAAGNDANWSGADLDLLTDFLGIDTRTSNGGNGDYDGMVGDPTYMTLTLAGVPAGTYAWTSFHHDTENVHAPFVVELDADGAGFVVVGEFQMSSSSGGGNPANPSLETGPDALSLSSTVTFEVVSDGVNEIVLRFTPLSQVAVHQQIFGINGFTLARTATDLIDQFTVSAPRVLAGGEVDLSWEVDPAATVVIEPGPGDVTGQTVDGAGGVSVVVGGPTTYTLSATVGDVTEMLSVTVDVDILVGFTASASRVEPGEEVTLSWEVGAGVGVNIDPDLGDVTAQTVDGVGSAVVTALSGGNTYTLTATLGEVMATATVSFTALPAEILLVDFNSTTQGGGPNNQDGYEGYDAGHEVAADFVPKEFQAFGATVTITPDWPNTTDNRVRQMIDRGAGNDANWLGDDLDLLTDWLGADARTGNGGNGDYDGMTGTPTYLTLTLGGLPGGLYAWSSFHHDTEHIHTEFLVEIDTDGTGFVEVGEFQMTDSTPGGNPDSMATVDGPDALSLSSTVELEFAALGGDVVFRFTPFAQIAVHQQLFGINGFQLELLSSDEPNLLVGGRGSPFGELEDGSVRTVEVAVRNTGQLETLNISAVSVAGADASHYSVGAFPATLAPGESGTVAVTIDPRGRSGGFVAVLRLESDDAGDPLVEVDLSAVIPSGNGLIAHYKMDEADGATLVDASGFGRHGTFLTAAGGGAFTLGEPGLAGGTAVRFDDAGETGAAFAEVGAGVLPALEEFTLSLWINRDIDDTGTSALFSKGTGLGDPFVLAATGNTLVWFSGGAQGLLLEEVLTPGTPQHVAVVLASVDGIFTSTIYLDGQPAGSQFAEPFDDSEQPIFQIAALDGGLGYTGLVDDVQIYDRPLAGADIGFLFANPGQVAPSPTVGPLDSDGDGVSDADEAIAGTDPNDPGSTFAPSAVLPVVGGALRLEVRSVPGRTYVLQYKENLADAAWTDVVTVVADSASTALDDTDAVRAARPAGFYRVLVRQ